MNMPAKADVDEKTRDLLTELALSDPELLLGGIEARADWQRKSGLDSRSFSLVKLAALVALDAPPSSYLWQVGNALDAGCTPEELVGVLHAIAPQVGMPKIVAAAPELMVALGIALPDGPELEKALMFVRRRPLLCAAAVGGGPYIAGRSMGRAAHVTRQEGPWRTTHRKPRWQVEVSIASPWRAGGR